MEIVDIHIPSFMKKRHGRGNSSAYLSNVSCSSFRRSTLDWSTALRAYKDLGKRCRTTKPNFASLQVTPPYSSNQLVVDHGGYNMGSRWSEPFMMSSKLCSRGQCLFYKLYHDLRASIGRLISVASVAVIVNNPYIVDPLFLKACPAKTDGS